MIAFRVISLLAICALLGAALYDLRRRESLRSALRELARQGGRGMLPLFGGVRKGWRERLRVLSLAFSFTFCIILALTGFSPVILSGSHLSGILLVIHVTFAPLFALSLSALALLWAHRLRFDASDWPALGAPHGERSTELRLLFALKAGFWIILWLSLPLLLTIILGLFPLFGTEGEAMLIRLHGYSALLVLLAALTEIYLIIAYTTARNMKENTP